MVAGQGWGQGWGQGPPRSPVQDPPMAPSLGTQATAHTTPPLTPGTGRREVGRGLSWKGLGRGPSPGPARKVGACVTVPTRGGRPPPAPRPPLSPAPRLPSPRPRPQASHPAGTRSQRAQVEQLFIDPTPRSRRGWAPGSQGRRTVLPSLRAPGPRPGQQPRLSPASARPQAQRGQERGEEVSPEAARDVGRRNQGSQVGGEGPAAVLRGVS